MVHALNRDWRERVTGMDEKRVDLEGLSPLRQANRLKVPLLIGHGKKDRTVQVSQSEEMEKALDKSGIKVETAYYDNQGHSIASSEDLTKGRITYRFK